jgi:hypothetical protein
VTNGTTVPVDPTDDADETELALLPTTDEEGEQPCPDDDEEEEESATLADETVMGGGLVEPTGSRASSSFMSTFWTPSVASWIAV